MLTKAADFVLQHPRNAFFAALLLSVFGPLVWLAQVVVALVTLRRGGKAGLVVLFASILYYLLIASFNSPVLLMHVLPDAFAIWGCALIIRRTESWAYALQALTLVCVLAVLLVHALMPNIDVFWTQQLHAYFAEISKSMPSVSQTLTPAMLKNFASVYTGIMMASVIVNCFLQLLLARFLQAKLFHPGALSIEIERMRLHLVAVLVLAVCALGVGLNNATATDVIPAILALFFIVGLCLTHRLVKQKQKTVLLFSLYLLLVLFFPYVAGLLVVFAMIDTCFHVRKRVFVQQN